MARGLLIGVALLAAGCSGPGRGARTVVLETAAYACGAEAGLGCGLQLAPVLARLDALAGVETSGATWDGRFVRIDVAKDADPARVAEEASRVLAPDAARVPATRAEDVAGPWYDAEGTRELSRHEAGVLAEGFAAELAPELALADGERARVAAACRAALERAFTRAHDAGGGVERLRAAVRDERLALAESLVFLGEARRAAVVAAVDARLAD